MSADLIAPSFRAHRPSGWPGARCLDCGNELPEESILGCRQCEIDVGPRGLTGALCPYHRGWVAALAKCPPDPELVKAFNEAYPV